MQRGSHVSKNKKKPKLISIPGDSSPQLFPGEEKEVIKPGILVQRLEDRIIPRVDDGIKDKDLKNPPPEVVARWYQEMHIAEYVHMERITRDGVTFNTKRVQFEFSRMLHGYRDHMDDRGVNPVIERLSFATINKISFVNNLANPLRYINYFIEYFDDDDELMRAYFQLMYQIMLDDTELDPISFVENVHAAFTTDSMVDKLVRMVEHNTDASLVKKADRAYDESIQLTIEHLKAIMGISCLHKFTIPLVSHYFNTRTRLMDRANMTDKDVYYAVFMSFMSVFDEVYDINLHNKLYHTSTTRITKTTNQESRMWERRKRLGTTPVSYTNELMRDFVIDISQKAVFAKSAIVFIHVCMDKAIHNTLIQSDKFDYMDLAMEASDSVNETMSRFDQIMRDKSMNSQLDQFRARVSNVDAIIRYGWQVGYNFMGMYTKRGRYPVDPELQAEYEYYMHNIHRPLNDTQIYFMKLFYGTLVGNSVDGNSIEFPDMIKLIMIMKRTLRQSGFNYFPFFLSGKVDASAGKKYNRRKIERLIQLHPLYEDLMEMYKDAEGYLNWDRMLQEIKIVVACPIKVIDYDYIEREGKLMRPTEMNAVDEVMRFLYRL